MTPYDICSPYTEYTVVRNVKFMASCDLDHKGDAMKLIIKTCRTKVDK